MAGSSDDGTTGVCVTDPSATTAVFGDPPAATAIAAQCCDGDTCHRSDGSGCIAGTWGLVFQYTTYEEAVRRCSLRGLTLCDQSCAGTGCNYNPILVWSSRPCPLPPSRL